MATPASRIILLKNNMYYLQLLRAPLFGASTNLNLQTHFNLDSTRLQTYSPVSRQHFLGDRANNMGGDLGVFTGSAVDAKWRFGGFGEMGRVESRGGRVISDDEDADDEDGDTDFDEDVEDFDDGDQDGDDDDDDDDDDE